MVTLDNVIKNVGKFKGELQDGRRDYERALQGSELIQARKSALEEALKEHTGFDDFNLPEEPTEMSITRGDMKFVITSDIRTKRPPYKEAIIQMENYLSGVSFLLFQGRQISGVFKRGMSIFTDVQKLFEAFDIIVGGTLKPGVVHTIEYEVTGKLAEEGPLEEITLGEDKRIGALTEENFVSYARMDRIEANLFTYVKAYQGLLTKGQRRPKKVTAVTSESAYKTIKSKAEGPDWAYVVKTLIKVPTDPESVGELNILQDPTISKAEKERRFPYYQLTYRSEDDTRILYVSIQSLSKRIQSLKEGSSIEARRLKVEPKEIV